MSQWIELTLMGVAIQSAPTIRSTQVPEEVDVKRSETSNGSLISEGYRQLHSNTGLYVSTPLPHCKHEALGDSTH
ncbi:hypothetical protein HBI24_209600 [Parastagonospora nodorum]|nr:hypothetical protein HBI95_219060 [Parastagonospora nodorum]KAH4596287.1 hypothetical protein HBH82_230450 [Parastagonospora nodorum]KAH4661401.1 hypothetical protein HBH78_222480 [Parastagonospora nodorum]KAH4769789.1 hypothetical protein HBH62_227920 [Parastagonospora nodorum]KAH5100723.1 hypothetical protein HBH71_228500 [Parastagonospora nodorum]